MTNRRPSLELANLRSISVPPRSAIDTGTCYRNKQTNSDNLREKINIKCKCEKIKGPKTFMQIEPSVSFTTRVSSTLYITSSQS